MSRPLTPKPDAQPQGPKSARRGRIHDRILDAYGRVTAGAPADRALQQVFKKARDLGSRERAEVGDVLFGLLRTQRRIDDRLERAARAEKRRIDTLDAPMLNRVRVLAYLAEREVGLEVLEATDPPAFKRLPSVLARIATGRLPRSKKKGLEALAIELCFPTWMARRLVDAFGETRTRVIGEGLDGRAPITLRVANRFDRDEIAGRIRTEQGWGPVATRLSPQGLILPRAVDLPTWALFREGAVELQDEGSQLVTLACGLAPNERVLDACAGAGGKTIALADALGAGGRVVAMDPESTKLDELKKRVARSDLAADVEVRTGDLTELPNDLEGGFDAVLVDAPCTGSGTLRRHPDLRWRLKDADIEAETGRQRRLLTGALAAVKPGGRLIYATCSVFAEENEAISSYLLEQEPRLAPLPLAELWGERLSHQLAATHEARIGPGPDRDGPDGFFIAAFRRRS